MNMPLPYSSRTPILRTWEFDDSDDFSQITSEPLEYKFDLQHPHPKKPGTCPFGVLLTLIVKNQSGKVILNCVVESGFGIINNGTPISPMDLMPPTTTAVQNFLRLYNREKGSNPKFEKVDIEVKLYHQLAILFEIAIMGQGGKKN